MVIRKRRWFLGSVGTVVAVLAVFVSLQWRDYQRFLARPLVPAGEESMILELESGESIRHLARRLEREGVIERALWLELLARMEGQAERIRAGEYEIPARATPADLLKILVGGRVRQYAFTIVEGWTFRELRQALADAPGLTMTLEGVDDEGVMERLGHPGEHPEGRFLPETYHYPKGTTDLRFLERAYDQMAALVAREWEGRNADLPLRSPYEALILASIVERETAVPAERPLIAGVFVNRLRRGMRLQTDPTVIYGLGEAFDGNLRSRDLRRDTPYNTYTRKGLPPTPIALPGAGAIHAALHPAETDALYFVAKGDGTHHFSATLKEHNRAVIRYQLGGRARPFSSNPEGKSP